MRQKRRAEMRRRDDERGEEIERVKATDEER